MESIQVSVGDTYLLAGESCLVTFNFLDNTFDFSQDDVVLRSSSDTVAGSLSGFTILSAQMYTVRFTPSIGFEGWVIFDVPFGSYSVGGTDPGDGGSSQTVNIDTNIPIAAISVDDTSLQFRETTLVTVTFSEVVTGFDWSDLIGPTGWFLPISSDGRTYTASYYPGNGWDYTQTPVQLSLAAGSYNDLSGNSGAAAASNFFTVDTVDENVVIFAFGDTMLTQGEALRIDVMFINPVSNFNPDDVVWPDDIASMSPWSFSLADSGPQAGMIEGAWAYLTPDSNVTSMQNYILVRGVASGMFAVDTLSPSPALISVSDSNLTLGESALVTVNFTEAVSGFGLEDVDLSQAAGNVSNFQQLSPTSFQMTFSPTQNVWDVSNVISIVNHGYTDIPGNLGTGGSSSNFTIFTLQKDTVPPSPIITLSTSLVTTSGMEITVLFNEPVQNFTLDDIGVVGVPGIFTAFVPENGGREYRVSFVPAIDWEVQDNHFIVYSDGYTDLAGNKGLEGVSGSFTVDSRGPTGVSLPLTDDIISQGEVLTVRLQFSELVTGLDVNDFDTTEAAVELGALIDEGGGIYTAIFMPIADRVQAVNRITIGDGMYGDLAGNLGFRMELPAFFVDTLRPSVALSLSDTVLVAGQSLILTIAFDEPVVGFDNNDIDLRGTPGTLGDLIFDGVSTYYVEFTPSPNITATSNKIEVRGDYIDIAGNAGVNQFTNFFDIDTKSPGLSIGISDAQLSRSESQTLTFTFSEIVSGFSVEDILLDGAAVSLTAFAPVIDGTVFTARYTPPDGILDPVSAFSVAAASYTDLLGNDGLGATSPDFSIDTSLPTIYGTAGNDTLVGGAGNDRLCGVPAAGSMLGKGSVDKLTGGGGADQFVLADQRGVFYNDGSNKSSGSKDYALISDFSRSQGDKIVVGDGIYFFASTSVGKTSGTGLYLDTNGSNAWDSKDELIALVAGASSGPLSVNLDLIHF